MNDQKAVSNYFFSHKELGAEYIQIVVDGKVTALGSKYAAGAETPGLPTGGDRYVVVAAFLSPLSPGLHTVTIRARLSGEALGGDVVEGEIPYTVIVQ